MIISELFFITELRSFFGNYILTFIIFSLIFFTAYATSNYYFAKLKKYINATPVILLIALFLSEFIPWGANMVIKLLFAIVWLVPPAIVLGIFFPLAMQLLINPAVVAMANGIGYGKMLLGGL